MSASTIKLLSIVGSPFINNNNEADLSGLDELLEYSKKNRMPLLYLKSLTERWLKDEYSKEYNELTDQWMRIEERITNVISILESHGIEYTTFKSIKPYIEVTVDIDLLIMNRYEDTLALLSEAGYTLLDHRSCSLDKGLMR